jgi:hypothetical protein
MKVAVSIPDPIFADAELLAKSFGTTRSDIYARALGEFIGNHAPYRVTQAMNDVVDTINPAPDNFNTEIARRIFALTEW